MTAIGRSLTGADAVIPGGASPDAAGPIGGPSGTSAGANEVERNERCAVAAGARPASTPMEATAALEPGAGITSAGPVAAEMMWRSGRSAAPGSELGKARGLAEMGTNAGDGASCGAYIFWRDENCCPDCAPSDHCG